MRVLKNKCTGCGECIKYCSVNAISLIDGTAFIDEDLCLECNLCFNSGVCLTNALEKPQLEVGEPRLIRRLFSDPAARHPITNMGGRGTVEMKTNEVSGRFKIGEAGIGVEVGRPVVGARLTEVEKIYKKVKTIEGIQFEKANPLSEVIDPKNPNQFKKEFINERILSAIIEFKVPTSSLIETLNKLKNVSKEIDTVFSVSLITKVSDDGNMENVEIAKKYGYNVSKNMKANLGLGKPRVL